MFDAVYISHQALFGDAPVRWATRVSSTLPPSSDGLTGPLRAIQYAATCLAPEWLRLPTEFRRPIIEARRGRFVQCMVSLTRKGPDGGTGYIAHPYRVGVRASVTKWVDIQPGAIGGHSEDNIVRQVDKMESA